jgi:hypothetical protein
MFKIKMASLKKAGIRTSAVIFLAAMFTIVLNTDLRSSIRGVIAPKYRVILAVAQADLDGSGEKLQILKVKTHEGLFLEVYGLKTIAPNSTVTQPDLLASIKLPDKKDGYFTFNSQVTNLAIDDINGDKSKEILATSFDDNLVAHLNVYRFVRGQKQLESVSLN